MALGDKPDGKLVFELSANLHGDHRIHTGEHANSEFGEDNREIIEVTSSTLDHVVGEIDPADTFLWMDTQGYEGFVLSGASIALKHHVPMCVEFWPYGLERSGSYPMLKEAFLSNGYKWFYNLDESATKIELTEANLDSLYASLAERRKFTDLLVI